LGRVALSRSCCAFEYQIQSLRLSLIALFKASATPENKELAKKFVKIMQVEQQLGYLSQS
jgi:hypothetical protein